MLVRVGVRVRVRVRVNVRVMFSVIVRNKVSFFGVFGVLPWG